MSSSDRPSVLVVVVVITQSVWVRGSRESVGDAGRGDEDDDDDDDEDDEDDDNDDDDDDDDANRDGGGEARARLLLLLDDDRGGGTARRRVSFPSSVWETAARADDAARTRFDRGSGDG